MLSKIRSVGKGLVGGQKAEVLRGQIRRWKALSIVAVLQDDANAIGCLGQLTQNTLLEEW